MNWVEDFLHILAGSSQLSSADQNKVYEQFIDWIHSYSEWKLGKNYEYAEIEDSIQEITLSIMNSIRGNGFPKHPQTYLKTVLGNRLRNFYNGNRQTFLVGWRRELTSAILDLENEGQIHSINGKLSINGEVTPTILSDEAISGYIYRVEAENTSLSEQVYRVLAMAECAINKNDLINGWLKYKVAITFPDPVVPTSTHRPPNIEGDVVSSEPQIADTDSLQPEDKIIIEGKVEQMLTDIEKLVNDTRKLDESQIIRIIYMFLGGSTLEKMAEATNLPWRTVDYYLNSRANFAVKMLITKRTTELTALLLQRGREEIAAYFDDNLTINLEEKYSNHLQDVLFRNVQQGNPPDEQE